MIYQSINQSMSTTTGIYDQAAMLTQHKQTQLFFEVTKLTQNTILPIIFTPTTSQILLAAPKTVTFMSEVKSELLNL